MSDSNEAVDLKPSLRARLLSEVKRKEFVGVIASILTVIGALTGGFFLVVQFIESTVEKRVDTLIKPHQQIFSAVVLQQWDYPWKVATILEKMLDSCEKSMPDNKDVVEYRKCLDKNLEIFVDLYLWSVSSAHEVDVGDFRTRFIKVLEVAGADILSNGHQLVNAGWYHLRSANHEESLRYFDAAIHAFRSDRAFRRSADAHWGRAFALILRGDKISAKTELLNAIRCAPSDYIWITERGEEFAISADLHLRGLTSSQPSIKKIIRDTVQLVQTSVKQDQVEYGYCLNIEPRFYASSLLADRFTYPNE